MRYLFVLIISVLWIPAVSAQADLAAGKTAYGVCLACHGANGEGNAAMNSPVLAGLDAAYLTRQLSHFKTGVRGGDASDVLGMQMRGMAATLVDDVAVTNVSAYIASLPVVMVVVDEVDADLRNGENQYNASCGACHGGKAQGNSALNAPRLAGQDQAYTERQYRNFGAGIRGAHPDDRYGRQMKMMAGMLASEKDIADVMAFIASKGAVSGQGAISGQGATQ
jgi:cytochrome c553